MRLPLRSHASFVMGLFVMTFGFGGLWGLGAALLAGSASAADVVTGGLALVLFMGASAVVGRFLYLQISVSRSRRAREQEVSDGNGE